MDGTTRRQALVATASAVVASTVPAARAHAALRPGALHPEVLHGHVRDLCAFGPRRTGTKAEHAAGAWVAERLRAAGLQVRVEEYGFRQWVLRSWSVELVRPGLPPRPIATHPIWNTRQGAGEVDLLDVGLGTPAELDRAGVRGKAILVSGKVLLNVFPSFTSLGTYAGAAQRGAAVMLATSDAPGNRVRLLATSDNRLDDTPIPAFTVGRDDLEVLKAAARAGGGAKLRWRLDAEHVDGRTRDVVAELPGSGRAGRRALALCAHHDSMFTGALDDATGVAGLLGLAAHFASLPRSARPKDLLFVAVTGHDTGFPHLGIRHWADTHPSDVARLDAFIALDHLASKGAEDVPGGLLQRPLDEERALFTTRHPALLTAALPLLVRHRLIATGPAPVVPEAAPNKDLEGLMADRGVPSLNLTMASPWYHTPDDTPDKIPPRQLARCVRFHADLVARLSATRSASLLRGA